MNEFAQIAKENMMEDLMHLVRQLREYSDDYIQDNSESVASMIMEDAAALYESFMACMALQEIAEKGELKRYYRGTPIKP